MNPACLKLKNKSLLEEMNPAWSSKILRKRKSKKESFRAQKFRKNFGNERLGVFQLEEGWNLGKNDITFVSMCFDFALRIPPKKPSAKTWKTKHSSDSYFMHAELRGREKRGRDGHETKYLLNGQKKDWLEQKPRKKISFPMTARCLTWILLQAVFYLFIYFDIGWTGRHDPLFKQNMGPTRWDLAVLLRWQNHDLPCQQHNSRSPNPKRLPYRRLVHMASS